MTRKMRSYVKGLILSLCGKPLPLTAKKEPVAYLYNGVRLPKLPEWDREMYPYVVMHEVSPYGYDAYALTEESYLLREVNNGKEWLWLKGTSPYLRTTYDPSKDSNWNDLNGTEGWREVDSTLTVAVGYGGEVTKPFIWSNHNVLEGGAVFFPKSADPIPVYE